MAEEVGRRIAMQRRRRGLSQAALAGLVGRSESWLSQVERGCRGVDSYTALRDLARVLRVDIALLAEGRSDATVRRPDPSEEGVTAIERARAQRRRDAEALVALLDVERHAPQVTRANAVARDTIRHLLGRARGTTGASVRALADRAGITGT